MKHVPFMLVVLLSAGLLGAESRREFFGYFENRFFLVEQRGVEWEQFNQRIRLGDYNRLRLMGKFAPSDKVVMNVAVDLFTFHGILKSPLGIYGGSEQAAIQGEWGKIDLDRASVDLNFKRFDLSIGKQRVAMGVSYLWAPLDIFNRVNLLEPKEEKPGATALRVYLPIRGKASLTGVFAPDADFSSSKSALRGQIQLGTVDVGLTLMRQGAEGQTIWGLDLRGETGIGWWLEGGLFAGREKTDGKLVVGFDYTFPLGRGIYWMGEFFHDSSGEADPAKYDLQKVISGERFTLGRTYFFSLLRYGISEFFSASLSYVGNWGDGSCLLAAAASVDLNSALTLFTGCYVPFGSASGEFSLRRQNVYYLWLKVNF